MGGWGMLTSLQLAHIRDATLMYCGEAAGEDCGDVATDEVKRQKRDGSPIEMNHKMMFY